jgi:deazaflavin-dependent oxidoreductase (nitroreductase family)
MSDRRLLRAFFRQFNRSFMVPAYRLGLGRLISNPLTGYYLLLGTRGRRSGVLRSTPVAYAIRDGCVYVMAGWGPETSWYRNVLASPRVRLRLADRGLPGIAEEVIDPPERAAALREILRNSGVMAFSEGVDPWHASDAEILRNAERKPVVRIASVSPVRAGAFDPGGKAWIVTAVCAAVFAGLVARRGHKS